MTANQVPAGAAQAVPADPAEDRRKRVADALNEADAWAQLQRRDDRERFADAALDALPELAAADQLRTGLTALIDEMTTKAAELDEDSRATQAAGHQQASNDLTVRCGMTYFLADRLRALLEET